DDSQKERLPVQEFRLRRLREQHLGLSSTPGPSRVTGRPVPYPARKQRSERALPALSSWVRSIAQLADGWAPVGQWFLPCDLPAIWFYLYSSQASKTLRDGRCRRSFQRRSPSHSPSAGQASGL